MHISSRNFFQSVRLANADQVVTILNVPYLETYWSITHVAIPAGEYISLEKKMDATAKELIHEFKVPDSFRGSRLTKGQVKKKSGYWSVAKWSIKH
jgi:hypothetical protein